MWSTLVLVWLVLGMWNVQAVEVQYLTSSEESNCDEKYATVGSTPCQYAHVRILHEELANLTYALTPTLTKLDSSNNLVRRVYIDIHLKMNAENDGPEMLTHTENMIEKTLDDFLTIRPWWLVISEGVQLKDSQVHKYSYHVYLLRYTQTLEAGLKLLGQIQYPSEEACETTHLEVDRMLGKGQRYTRFCSFVCVTRVFSVE
jgi:hypothetical protein